MNSKTWARIIALALFAALALPLQLDAQAPAQPQHQYHHYKIVDPGTFGGPSSGLQNPNLPRAGVLNNHGTLVGIASTPAWDPYCGCNAGDAFQYQNGVTTDLGRVPGGIDSQANWVSGNGLITGLGDDGIPDPSAGFPIPHLHGLLWDHGIMTDLGTLPEGGNVVFPNGVNNRGEVVGAAQNTVPDPNTMFFPGYGTQSRAFYWKDGVMQDLGTLGTGTDATAALINERGQVVGWSYTNSTPSAICAGFPFLFPLTTSSFIWDEHHGMHDIGGLGGTCTIAQDLNNRGQIVGDSALTGDTLLHPFVWDSANGMTDLGTARGNYGEARAINEHGDVVGQVCDAAYTSCPAVLWRKAGGKWRMINLGTIVIGAGGCAKSASVNASAQVVGTDWCTNPAAPFLSEDGGPVVDLNTLVPPNSGIQLVEGVQINDRGEIAVQGPDANGNNHALLLIPCDGNHPGVVGCDYSLADASEAIRVSPNAAQVPASLIPGNRMPGMLNRSRSPLGRRAPGRGTVPTPIASMALPAAPDTSDLLGEHHLNPQIGTPAAYCGVSNGTLTGVCAQSTSPTTCQISFNGCPMGQPASFFNSVNCITGTSVLVSNIKCFSLPGFDVASPALAPTTISVGGSATTTVTVSNYGGFSGPIALSCSVQPAPAQAPTCFFRPNSITAGTSSALTVSTTAPTSALRWGAGSGLFYAFFLPFGGLFAMVVRFRSAGKAKGELGAAALACMLLAGCVGQSACGGSSVHTPGTPTGQYIITVTGKDASGTLVSSTTMPPLYVQ